MSDVSDADAEGVDFVVVAYREEGVWQVDRLADDTAADVETLASELRRWPGDGGALGLVSVDEDFCLLVRVLGAQTLVLLSDVTAANDWPVARSALDFLDLPLPDDDDQEPGAAIRWPTPTASSNARANPSRSAMSPSTSSG